MFIAPNSDIWLCSGIPFDMGYENTKYYLSSVEQFSNISSKALIHLTDLSYIQNGNEIRLEVSPSTLYKCNYLIFKNTSFENHYFYAFITGYKYINNACYAITFQLDVLQTWMFDYSLRECFIDREHARDDSIGANIEDEGLETGEFLSYHKITLPIHSSGGWTKSICIAATFDSNFNDAVGTVTTLSGLYSGLIIHEFKTPAAANTFLTSANEKGKIDGIVAVFMAEGWGNSGDSFISRASATKSPFEGYVPKNNKLYCYPYNYLAITNNNGQVSSYRWEYAMPISGQPAQTLYFHMYTPKVLSTDTYLLPENYKGLNDENTLEMMMLGGYPQCSWNNDTYKSWLAQNANYLRQTNIDAASKVVIGIGEMSAGAYSGDTQTTRSGVNTLTGAISEIMHLRAKKADMDILAPAAHVASGGKEALFEYGHCKFEAYFMCIPKFYAERIDMFFTKYGYKANITRTPLRYTRSRFNYIKTVDCQIVARCPADDARMIENIFNNGVRFWHTTLDTIGYYQGNNEILPESEWKA